jgi:SAM-dependent methyltransferase
VTVLSLSPAPAEIEPLDLYASAIDTSDYVTAVAPVVRRLLGKTGDLLDVGAGGGQIGEAIRDPGRDRAAQWTAIEPSAAMRIRLQRYVPPPRIVASGWQQATIASRAHDTVLAATMPAYFDQPEAFLARCLAWARRAVVWIVPAQAGPRGLCFAGCLPAQWHGEDETPGIEVVLRGLAPELRPHEMVFATWTFSGVVPDLAILAGYLAERLAWPRSDFRRQRLLKHLRARAKPDPQGHRLDIPRKSAVLVWRHS